MTEWAANLLERYLRVSHERAQLILHGTGVIGTSVLFVLLATVLVGADAIFFSGRNVSALAVGDIAQQDIRAPQAITYTSEVLTQRVRDDAAAAVPQIYDPTDPNIVRQQTLLARQILDFINNVRRDPFGTLDQKIEDINRISDLTLDGFIVQAVLETSPDAWQAIDDQIVSLIERLMRDSIREPDLSNVRNQLPSQVSVRFTDEETAIIVAIVGDLLRANTFANPEATAAARQVAADAVEPVTRTFVRNEIVVREGERLDDADLEALAQLGLRQNGDSRLQEVGRAVLASVLAMVIIGLYILRFDAHLYENSRQLLLLAVIFLIVLLGVRLVNNTGQIYLYPSAALAMVYVSLVGSRVALIGTLGLALLGGVMLNNSLEIATLIGAGGLIATLALRRIERLNSYFLAGLMVSLTNTLIVAIFHLGTIQNLADGVQLSTLVLFSLLNGILAATTAIAGLYIVTLLFNLPTSLKLAELSQPSHPLLRRLLRDAPGTYQHSLQVANLSEQAALAIGANAELVRVAALYHDIGKMLNAAFFIENQQFGGGNPHDVLKDPYRSADIIISHVTDGDEMARQNGLPSRFRDFIREHHGTTQVYYYFRKAVEMAGGDESAVDIDDFTYPGPKPQSRETAIMMLADSCEAAVRSKGPSNRQEISEIIQKIIDGKMRDGQLDQAGLTLDDLKAIRDIFVEMLQAVFHPRINYPPTDAPARPSAAEGTGTARKLSAVGEAGGDATSAEEMRRRSPERQRADAELRRATVEASETLTRLDEDDNSPLPEVPKLPRAGERRRENNGLAGRTDEYRAVDEQDENA